MACADCKYWVATEMEVVPASHHPHRQNVRAETEMLRATHALCSWSAMNQEAAALFAKAPGWIQKSHAAGGTLTHEDDGAECVAFEARTPDKGTG